MIARHIYLYDTSILNPDISVYDRKKIDSMEDMIRSLEIAIGELISHYTTVAYDIVQMTLEDKISDIIGYLSYIAKRYPVPVERVYNRMTLEGLWWSPSSFIGPRQCGWNGNQIQYFYE
jgi:hypothetical protein